MNKRIITLGILILTVSVIIKLAIIGLKHIKVDDFKPNAVVFLVDSSASNQSLFAEQVKYIKQLCKLLDPEDYVEIYKISNDTYHVYTGSPANTAEMSKAIDKFAKVDAREYGTNYGKGIKKVLANCIKLKTNENYDNCSVVVLGDLEDEAGFKIDYKELAKITQEAKIQIPDMALMFAYAHPQKLELVKDSLSNVLNNQKLVLVNEVTVNKSPTLFLKAIGR
ncbi:VWA domain-containing protein [bacterium]|nr:VWA domain-containing protein [bacterium]